MSADTLFSNKFAKDLAAPLISIDDEQQQQQNSATSTNNDAIYSSENMSAAVIGEMSLAVYAKSLNQLVTAMPTMLNATTHNQSKISDDALRRDFIFDRTDVRVIFISLYTLVFCCCFCGNFLVILVVVMSRRLRSITNFFLANLAVADLCVGVFCVLQNLSIYLIESWVFGEFLCKMYQFVHALSYTASIFILMVICMERYFAIIYPITCKQILTTTRLRFAMIGVWLASAIYSTPKFIFSRTITNVYTNGMNEEICIMHRKLFNSKVLDCVNFVALYVLPLLVMTILYSRIAIVLWKSFQGLERHCAIRHAPTSMAHFANGKNGQHKNGDAYNQRYSNKVNEKKTVRLSSYQPVNDRIRISPTQTANLLSSNGAETATPSGHTNQYSHHRHNNNQFYQISSNNVLLARRGVIRMLIIVVLTFALCNLPLHARKIWQYWSDSYKGSSNFNAVFTPLTFLVSYFNSAINPLLYAFLSKNFRKGMRELLCCSYKKGKIGEPYQPKTTTIQVPATSEIYSEIDSLPASGYSLTTRAGVMTTSE